MEVCSGTISEYCTLLNDSVQVVINGRLYSVLFRKSYAWTVTLQVFVNARLHVSGGALGGGRMVEDASSVAGLNPA